MFINYFKTAFRNLQKNKAYSLLNIFGLAMGIACAALIFLWVEDELNWDSSHVKKDRLYYVKENQQYNGNTLTFSSTPGLLGPAIQAEVPGIANTCRMNEDDAQVLFTIGDKVMYASGRYAEPAVFSLFTLPFTEGNAATAFNQLYSIVLTQKTAIKFFGTDKNVIGRTVRADNKQDYVITGVLKNIPENSSLQFEWVSPFQIWFNRSEWAHRWGSNCLSTYVELQPGVHPDAVNKLLHDFIKHKKADANASPFLFSMNDWHLRDKFENGVQTGGGRIEYVRLFSVIAWIILLIACFNFMNMATARSEKRAREIGVRKVLGAGKQKLIVQFIGEAMFMTLLSSVLALIIISITLPAFNTLVQKHLGLGLSEPIHLLALLAIVVICGLVAGSYPSFYLSSFNPVFALKGVKLKTGSASLVRKGLVVAQFGISIVLIISTLVIYRQIQHVKSRNLGMNKNNLLQTGVIGSVARHYNVIRQDLLNTGAVESVALSDYPTLYSGNNTGGMTWEGKASTEDILISQRFVSTGFFNTSGIQILSGRDVTAGDSGIVNKTINIVITQSLEKLMGKGSALGKKLWYQGDTSGLQAQVVGVVNDYVYGDMYGRPDPVMFFYAKPENTTQLYIRFKPQANIEKALAQVQAIMTKNNPAYPFNWQFVDDQFNQLFLNEALISKLSRLFAALAILISCLGLFGLAAYTAERRTKEIGVRKVLGASVANITSLLSADFIKLVAIACVIAFPVAWLAMHRWLQNYQYRINIGWWIFIAAGLTALVIALLTISFTSIKAALANPVKNLRTE
jgi:predicted permease